MGMGMSGAWCWLSNDPIDIFGGLNQYVFCGNNPVNFKDPLGLDGTNACSSTQNACQVAGASVLGLFTWSGSSQINYLWNQIQNTMTYMRNFPVGSLAWQSFNATLQSQFARLAATAGASYTAGGCLTGYGAIGLTVGR